MLRAGNNGDLQDLTHTMAFRFASEGGANTGG
eukprot:COSAG04_NODE_1216_length_7713_cov_2.598897_3_plen_32_part_00